MNEKDFELLDVLKRTGNITRAADYLYTTQSAVSKRIRALEQELGMELLIRTRQGIRFTPAGEAALEESRIAASALTTLRRRIDAMQDQLCGHIRVGISLNYARYKLADALAEYHKKYPNVRICILTGQSRDLYKQLTKGILDVAILRGEFPWDGEQSLLSTEPICVVYNKEFEGKPLTEAMYINRHTDPTQSALLTRWLREQKLDNRHNQFSVDNIDLCLEMIRQGLGWGILPEIAINNYDGCRRPCVFANGEVMERNTYILCQHSASELPQVTAFINHIQESAQRQAKTPK